MTAHPEKHFTGSETVSDIVIGMSDGLTGDTVEAATQGIISDRERWVNFMMKQELGLEEPDPKRALRSALTIGLAYVAGGVIPLAPYALNVPLNRALLISAALTLVALFIFGALKGRFTGGSVWRSAFQTLLVGAAASGAAFLIARAVSGAGGAQGTRTGGVGGAE